MLAQAHPWMMNNLLFITYNVHELAHTLLTDLLVQLWKFYGWQNRTRWHYVTLLGSTESYGEHTQTRTFKNHANFNTCLQCTPQRIAFNVLLNAKVALPLKPSQHLLFKKSARIGSYSNTATCTVDYATTFTTMCVGTLTIHLHPLYLLSTLYMYVTHMINYSRPSTAFLYCKQWKVGPGNEATEVDSSIALSLAISPVHTLSSCHL